MPLNSIPPTTNVDNLNTKLKAATSQCRVDVGFWGGVIPGNEVRHRLLKLKEFHEVFGSGDHPVLDRNR